MTAYILRRLAQMIPLLLGVTVVLFAVTQAAPGGPEHRVACHLAEDLA